MVVGLTTECVGHFENGAPEGKCFYHYLWDRDRTTIPTELLDMCQNLSMEGLSASEFMVGRSSLYSLEDGVSCFLSDDAPAGQVNVSVTLIVDAADGGCDIGTDTEGIYVIAINGRCDAAGDDFTADVFYPGTVANLYMARGSGHHAVLVWISGSTASEANQRRLAAKLLDAVPFAHPN